MFVLQRLRDKIKKNCLKLSNVRYLFEALYFGYLLASFVQPLTDLKPMPAAALPPPSVLVRFCAVASA